MAFWKLEIGIWDLGFDCIIVPVSRSSALYRLQTIDTELDLRRAQLAEADAKLADSPAVRKTQAVLTTAQANVAAARQKAKAIEDESQTLAAKIAEVEEQLYGGKIKNPRELKDLQDDAESLKRRRSALDDQQLAAMEAVEAAEAGEAAARESLAAAEAARAIEQSDLLRDKGALQALIAKASGEREAALSNVNPDDLALYDSLRQRKRGLGVSLLENGACSGCGEAPSSARIQAMRQGNDLVRCSNCDRILHAGQKVDYNLKEGGEDEMIFRW